MTRRNYFLIIEGAIIASKTKIIPNDSTSPKAVPKTSQLITTEAAGSVVAVIDASSGVRNFNPALNDRNAHTVPKKIIQHTSNKTSADKNGNQFRSSISAKVDNPPTNIPTPVKKYGSIFFANKCFGKIALNANAAPLAKDHTTQPSGTKIFVGLPPVTNKNTPLIAKITATTSPRFGKRRCHSDSHSTTIAGHA